MQICVKDASILTVFKPNPKSIMPTFKSHLATPNSDNQMDLSELGPSSYLRKWRDCFLLLLLIS